jgi:hypothetical protein
LVGFLRLEYFSYFPLYASLLGTNVAYSYKLEKDKVGKFVQLASYLLIGFKETRGDGGMSDLQARLHSEEVQSDGSLPIG